MKRSLALVLALALFVCLFAGCGGSKQETPAQTSNEPANNEPIKIGLSTAMNIGAITIPEAVHLRIKQLNDNGGLLGRPVELVEYDDGWQLTGAINASNIMLDEKVCVVAGPGETTQMKAVASTYADAGIPFVCPSSDQTTTEDTTGYMFSGTPCDIMVGKAAADFVTSEYKPETVGIMYGTHDFGLHGMETMKKEFEALNVNVETEAHNLGDTDFTAAIASLTSKNVNAIVVWTDGTEMILIARQLHEMGVDVPIFFSAAMAISFCYEACDPAWIEGCYCITDFIANDKDEKTAQWQKDYKAEYGQDVDLFAARGLSCVEIILAAIEKAGTDDPAAIHKALQETKDVWTPCGIANYDPATKLMFNTCFLAKCEGGVPHYYATIEG